MSEDSLKKFIRELESIRKQWQKVPFPKKEDNIIRYEIKQVTKGIWECIKWANAKLTGDHWWGTEWESGKIPPHYDLSDPGIEERGPTDLRDDWPHAKPVPGGARLGKDVYEKAWEVGKEI